MNNVIFGSGIVGLAAKLILGPTWKLVPFYRSRFFTFNPALDDNFIIRDEQTDEFIKDVTSTTQVSLYRRAWSVGGQLVSSWDKGLCTNWAAKIFGLKIPPQTEPYFSNRMDVFVYNVRVNELYKNLMAMNLNELQTESKNGLVTEIGDHYFIRNGIREDFDNAVSTIPLDAMNKLMNVKMELPSKDIHYYHIQTNSLDFEGHNQVLVVDPMFSFYKASNIAPQRFLFYCHDEIQNPGIYFMSIMRSFDILDGTSVKSGLTMGPPPNLEWYENKGIYCVGSYAQWDWCMDVGSCILRLQRYAQRGFKPFKKELIA